MKTRRTQNLVTVALACVVVFIATNAQEADPLPSWNDGPAKSAILAFVNATTETRVPSSSGRERIATFDQDGTSGSSSLSTPSCDIASTAYPMVVKAKPELAQPSLSRRCWPNHGQPRGDRQALDG